MRWLQIAALTMGLMISEASIARGPDATYFVRVGKSTFRVSRSGEVVEVAKKSVFVLRSVQLRDQMREAVAQATGCSITDELMTGNILQGKLSCEKPTDGQRAPD